jgi:superfamily II DNA helicase RecQ
MDEFSRIFLSYDEYRIIVCTICQFAVVPSQIEHHLKKHHSRLTHQQRRIVAQKVQSLPQLALVESDVIYPRSDDPPINTLPVFFDGLKCTGKLQDGSACQYICRTITGIQKHCKDGHDWVNVQKRGGDARGKRFHSENRLWECNRACQRFFKVGKWQKYFEIAANGLEAITEHTTNQKHLFFQARKEEVKRTSSDLAKAANTVQGFDNHRSTVVPWLRETGIAKHIAQLKKDEIKAATALPSLEGEGELRSIVDAMESLLREAHSLCFDGTECMLTWPCRVVLSRFQSSQVDTVGKTRAFDPYKEPGTLKSYFRISQRFLSYFHRVVFPDEYYFDIENTDEQAERPEDVVKATDEQLVAWNDVWQIAKKECQSEEVEERKQKELKDRLLEMWMLIISHDTGARRYQSPLLSFCAMLSVKPSTQGWLEPGNFNSHLSAIIWVVQLLVFYDSACKEQRGQGQTLQLVKRCCGRYLQQTVETPMGEILRWRLLLFKISKESMGDHEASWDESEQVLTYEDTELHMDQIPTLLATEYQDCYRLLYDELMMGQRTMDHMHSWALKDGPNTDTIDWNFTQHRDNVHILRGADTALLSAIDGSEQLSHVFLSTDARAPNGFVWRETALAAYNATVQQFLQRLCVLMHVSGGQPVRESEFFEMTWRNTQRRRSITIRHDRVMVHVKYHKGQQQTGRYKENVRFLANPVGELLLDYLVYVMPLRQTFLRHHSPKALLPPFLWEKDGKVWPESQLSRYLEEASTRACIPRLHVANWRQITVAIVKTKFASQIACFDADDEDEDAEEMDEAVQIMTRQRNHKTQTVNRAYANQTGAVFSNLWDGQIRMGLKASNLWQDFWGVDAIMKGKKRIRPTNGSKFQKRVAMGIYRPRKPWSAEALLGGLKKLYGDENMTWRCPEQEQALEVIMSGREQVVAVLPTGSGKSLLFMLPCTLPGAQVTILVVPLVSLRGDLLRRMQALRIDHLEWTPGERREVALVIVSTEAASTKDFVKYARGLIARQKLDRIVVDECHLTVTAVEYRPTMVDVTALRCLRTQFVYMTATLPPLIQAEFQERNYLVCPTIIRASSNRTNIFYMVRKADPQKGSLLEQTTIEVSDAWNKSDLFDHSCDKIIIYVRTRDEAHELASNLSCESYTSQSGDPQEKKNILERWTHNPTQPFLVATTALAEGFDYPHVRLVVNVNEPESLVLFAQESGRAGRDGAKAYSLVLLPSTWEPQFCPNEDEVTAKNLRYDTSLRKQKERQAVHRYLQGGQCYRTSLTEHLDIAEHRRWCMIEDVTCDFCPSSHAEPISLLESAPKSKEYTGLDAMQKEKLQAYDELARYREYLFAVRGTCLLCRACDEPWDHVFSKCSRRHKLFDQRNGTRRKYEAVGKTWFKPFTACFWCCNPQSVCQRADIGDEKQPKHCSDKDIVLPLCYGVFVSMHGSSWIQEQFGRYFPSIDTFFDWLGEETVFGGGSAIQAVRVAAAALQQFEI